MSGDSTQANEQVEWRDVPGWPRYRASSEGNVETQWAPGKITRGDEWRPVKLHRNGDDYLAFNVSHVASPTGKQVVVTVHRFVCLAFHGLPQPGQETRHFPDRNIENNRPENLSWATHAENLADKFIHGTNLCGEKCHFAKLTRDKAIQIHRLSWAGVRNKDIAEQVGTSRPTVSLILAFKTWKSVQEQVMRERGNDGVVPPSESC